MTTRRGEPIESFQTVENILRPLAETTAACPECLGAGSRQVVGSSTVPGANITDSLTLMYCPPCILESRFEALRIPFIVASDRKNIFATWGGIDASLGAIVRAAAACGLAAFIVSLEEVRLVRQDEGKLPWQQAWYGFGTTVEEAAARALVAAWEAEEERAKR